MYARRLLSNSTQTKIRVLLMVCLVVVKCVYCDRFRCNFNLWAIYSSYVTPWPMVLGVGIALIYFELSSSVSRGVLGLLLNWLHEK